MTIQFLYKSSLRSPLVQLRRNYSAKLESCNMMSNTDIEDFLVVHDRAVKKGKKTYIDPATGYTVMTSLCHKERGYCCGNACRHCPFEHSNVGKPEQIQKDKKSARLNTDRKDQAE